MNITTVCQSNSAYCTNWVKERFGTRLRQLRKKQGFSQEGFAQHCKLSRSYMGEIERGEMNVSLENIEKIAIGLEITLTELFAWDEQPIE